MIRGFSLLCKINFNHYSTLDLFYCCMSMINVHDYPCPRCGTKHPSWEKHGSYERYLIGFKRGAVICNTVNATRLMCQSCGSTHAILPEFVIPFKSYNLLFVLAVMKDHFISPLTVGQLCAKYEIAASTLYTWQAMFLRHKTMWLGILDDILTSAEKFLDFLLNEGLERNLHEFFAITNHSFLQSCSDSRGNGRFTSD